MNLKTIAAASSLALGVSPLWAINSVSLQFNGTGNTLAATGFGNVYQLDSTGFSVAGGKLTMQTLPGDTFGDYENDPDTAKNMFYTEITPYGRTVATARVNVANLNTNFHGGGIWMGTDQDHYIRTAVINNTFEGGGISFEALRENEDRWPMANPPGPGNDIDGRQYGLPGLSSPLLTPIDAILRIIRNGNNARTALSLDNGATWIPSGGPTVNHRFDSVATSPTDPGVPGVGNTVEGNFKVGLYAFGGPDGQIPATFAWDEFRADSYLQGDFNSDRTVDIGDFAILGSNFNTPGVWETGDANEDDIVDIGDFALLAANFNQTATGSLPRAAVPEPTTAALATLLLMALHRRRGN
jgi:hypothetical protein